MKFKQEDIGLYFGLILIGGGVGLMAGAILASRVALDEIEEERETVQRVKNIQGYKAVKMSSRREGRSRLNEEFLELVDEYSPNKVQIEMVNKGLVSVEELRAMLEQEKSLAEVKLSLSEREEMKPDLSDLVNILEDDLIVDDRFQVLEEAPEGSDPRRLRVIYYIDETGDFFVLNRMKDRIPVDIEHYISVATWEIVEPLLTLEDFEFVHVDDLKNSKFYRFELASLEEEDTDEDYNED